MLIRLVEFHPEWSDWWYRMGLSPFARLFLLLLVLVSIYAAYSAGVILVRLRYLRKHRTVEKDNPSHSLARFKHRVQNLRQIITAMFYLFGLTFFTQIHGAYWTPENNRPVGLMVLENFSIYFSYAAFISLVFLVLHSFQWFISSQIRKTALMLNSAVSG